MNANLKLKSLSTLQPVGKGNGNASKLVPVSKVSPEDNDDEDEEDDNGDDGGEEEEEEEEEMEDIWNSATKNGNKNKKQLNKTVKAVGKFNTKSKKGTKIVPLNNNKEEEEEENVKTVIRPGGSSKKQLNKTAKVVGQFSKKK
eukprot:CAMPEP_0114334624 /NCGR_PEP_ID=MMETSP0101-20121206/4509_1 /TAXON_ID=38822 ORGANISM="Pteridomonas danica, Strain PT" /NCGR_SAMPLE_ID=MMETSP0101 /ASSEMBLY_ACC=CAM_ASM_000211 /LENGTH=142 /DNA_ID=CAMNT_0001465965 /DNA_START=538 /DNA_END=966 /DNA_ORIENTATION=+